MLCICREVSLGGKTGEVGRKGHEGLAFEDWVEDLEGGGIVRPWITGGGPGAASASAQAGLPAPLQGKA
ncbi:hypothetical protein GCM10023213_12540 [Prosthecobacter algae]|uniref:Uncharacterized protein n=1 Tax=Prosthecobacter algae TaxID=1144682 RepID=A0ABP9NZA4_9BACT